ARFDAVGTWAQFTAVLPAIALGSFVFLSPTSDVIAPPEAAGAEGEGGGEDAPSVMVLMLDELPTESLLADDGTIDRVRFPHIAEFADESTWYRNYTSSAQGTLMAIPSILTGTPPREDAAINANYPDNLFSLLEPTHDMRVSEAVTSLCAPSTCRIGGD